MPYSHGSVDWTTFKEYLKEYFIQNAGEVAALYANKKPEKDKDYFCRITGGVKVKDKSIHCHNVSGFIQGVVADMVSVLLPMQNILLPIIIDFFLSSC